MRPAAGDMGASLRFLVATMAGVTAVMFACKAYIDRRYLSAPPAGACGAGQSAHARGAAQPHAPQRWCTGPGRAAGRGGALLVGQGLPPQVYKALGLLAGARGGGGRAAHTKREHSTAGSCDAALSLHAAVTIPALVSAAEAPAAAAGARKQRKKGGGGAKKQTLWEALGQLRASPKVSALVRTRPGALHHLWFPPARHACCLPVTAALCPVCALAH